MQAKLKLNLEELSVDSFDTMAAEKPKGTVFGEQCTCWTQCAQNTCPGCPTCDASCAGSCGVSCYGTCGATCGQATCGQSCYQTCGLECGGTMVDATCRNYGTCDWGAGPCQIVP